MSFGFGKCCDPPTLVHFDVYGTRSFALEEDWPEDPGAQCWQDPSNIVGDNAFGLQFGRLAPYFQPSFSVFGACTEFLTTDLATRDAELNAGGSTGLTLPPEILQWEDGQAPPAPTSNVRFWGLQQIRSDFNGDAGVHTCLVVEYFYGVLPEQDPRDKIDIAGSLVCPAPYPNPSFTRVFFEHRPGDLYPTRVGSYSLSAPVDINALISSRPERLYHGPLRMLVQEGNGGPSGSGATFVYPLDGTDNSALLANKQAPTRSLSLTSPAFPACPVVDEYVDTVQDYYNDYFSKHIGVKCAKESGQYVAAARNAIEIRRELSDISFVLNDVELVHGELEERWEVASNRGETIDSWPITASGFDFTHSDTFLEDACEAEVTLTVTWRRIYQEYTGLMPKVVSYSAVGDDTAIVYDVVWGIARYGDFLPPQPLPFVPEPGLGVPWNHITDAEQIREDQQPIPPLGSGECSYNVCDDISRRFGSVSKVDGLRLSYDPEAFYGVEGALGPYEMNPPQYPTYSNGVQTDVNYPTHMRTARPAAEVRRKVASSGGFSQDMGPLTDEGMMVGEIACVPGSDDVLVIEQYGYGHNTEMRRRYLGDHGLNSGGLPAGGPNIGLFDVTNINRLSGAFRYSAFEAGLTLLVANKPFTLNPDPAPTPQSVAGASGGSGGLYWEAVYNDEDSGGPLRGSVAPNDGVTTDFAVWQYRGGFRYNTDLQSPPTIQAGLVNPTGVRNVTQISVAVDTADIHRELYWTDTGERAPLERSRSETPASVDPGFVLHYASVHSYGPCANSSTDPWTHRGNQSAEQIALTISLDLPEPETDPLFNDGEPAWYVHGRPVLCRRRPDGERVWSVLIRAGGANNFVGAGGSPTSASLYVTTGVVYCGSTAGGEIIRLSDGERMRPTTDDSDGVGGALATSTIGDYQHQRVFHEDAISTDWGNQEPQPVGF